MNKDPNFNAGAEIIDRYVDSGQVRVPSLVEDLLSREDFHFDPRLRDYFHERVVETGLTYNRTKGVYEIPQ